MKNKFDKSSKALMTCDLINSLVNIFRETFLVAYLLQITNNNIVQVSIYYIVVYFLLSSLTFLQGNFLKRNPEKRVTMYRLGIMIMSIFVLIIALLKDKVSDYFLLIAVFCGISESLYWASYGIMLTEVVENNMRKSFVTTKRILSRLISIIFPIILGTSIELTSFANVAIYIFILTTIQIIVSFMIDKRKFNNKTKLEKYSIKKYIRSVSDDKKVNLNRMYKLSFIYGIMMDTIRVLVVVITIMTFKTSFNLGVLTTVFSICAMFSLYLFNKKYKKKNAKTLLALCATFIVVGVIGLLININRTTLIIYNFTYCITIYILEVMFKIKEGLAVKEYKIENWVVEYETVIGFFMDLGRIIGFSLMLIAGLINNTIIFKILLLLVTLCIPVYAKLMYESEKEHNQSETVDKS